MDFKEASEAVKNLSKRPDNNTLLQLYALFKQASEGDVSGKRPGMLDVKGRAKYDAWSKISGTDQSQAESQYVQLVQDLIAKDS